MNTSQPNGFKQRICVGAGIILIVFSSILLSTTSFFRPLFVILTAAFIGTTVWEYCQMVLQKGYPSIPSLSILSAVVYTLSLFLSTQFPIAQALPHFILLCTLAAAFLHFFCKEREPIVNIALSLFPIAYLVIPLSCILLINYFPFAQGYPSDGRIWLLYALATSKMSDIGGYFCGKLLGRHLLSPVISPKKTWEGALGGFCCAMVTSYLFSFLLGISSLTAILLGAIIAILAQFGDLAESLLKRDAHLKDSNQIPGLGGALDIADSLVFTLPIVYFYLLSTFKVLT